MNFAHHARRKIKIKLEIDTSPPNGSQFESQTLSFPVEHSITVQDLNSNFAGKCHALLCRPYVKGRDWYDFIWYINKNINPNLDLLQNALDQFGPWAGQKPQADKKWLHFHFTQKITEIDWNSAKQDVAPFINSMTRQSLDLWEKSYFIKKLDAFCELIS